MTTEMQVNKTIPIDTQFSIAPISDHDVPALVTYLNDPEIYKCTSQIPYPYTISNAEWFIGYCKKKREQFGREMEWKITDNSTGEMAGGIGLHGKFGVGSHRDEIGYWLARKHWGKNIMSAAVKSFCKFAFEHYGLERIEATVFTFNPASQRVLEKCGFEKEGILRKACKKDDQIIDAILYSIIN